MGRSLYFSRMEKGAITPYVESGKKGAWLFGCIREMFIELEPHEEIEVGTGVSEILTHGFELRAVNEDDTLSDEHIEHTDDGEIVFKIKNDSDKKAILINQNAYVSYVSDTLINIRWNKGLESTVRIDKGTNIIHLSKPLRRVVYEVKSNIIRVEV